MTTIPNLTDLDPRQARLFLRIQERSAEIVQAHAPEAGATKPPISPLATIHIEALAHIAVLQRLHESGAAFHSQRANHTQAALWQRDSEILEMLFLELFRLHIA
jgi:hypothetical protein